jgi:Zinc finger C-x8-C-x5-C-x3-H type (and similar)./RNA recognition motif.
MIDYQIDEKKALEDFLEFYENMYEELGKFGRIDCLCVCDNLGDHMLGHVYCKFMDEENAADALNVMNGRYYDGKKMEVEFSPVTDFREARCRDFDEGGCARGGFCNFMHIKPVPLCLIRSLEEDVEYERRKVEEDMRRRSSRDRSRDRDREERRKRKRHSRHGSSRDSRKGKSERKRSRRSRSYSSSRSRSRSRSDSRSRSVSRSRSLSRSSRDRDRSSSSASRSSSPRHTD